MTESFEQRHTTLIREFNEYLFDHPEFTERLPAGAVVVIQVADDPEYNAWGRALGERNWVEALAPRRSRLVNPQLRMTS